MPEHEPTPTEPQPLQPDAAPPARPRVPVFKRPWIPWSLCLLLAIGATALTAKAIVERDEASRAIKTAQQQTKQEEEEIEEQQAALEDAQKARRDLRDAWSDCRRTGKLVIDWLESLHGLLEQAQTGSLQGVLTAATKSEAARRNLFPQFRSCDRQATKVT